MPHCKMMIYRNEIGQKDDNMIGHGQESSAYSTSEEILLCWRTYPSFFYEIVLILTIFKTIIAQAKNAKRAALKGTSSKKALKVRHSTTFRRPNTLKLARSPKYTKSVPHYPRMDVHTVLVQPITSETAMKKVEDSNTLVFQVSLKANKYQIKKALKDLYEVEADKVHTLVRPNGTKKAYIKLTSDYDALDIANKIGYI